MIDYGKVSIICPLYNCEKFVGRTIESVLAQTYDNFELLIVDDLSTDSSIEVVKKFNDVRIKLLFNDKNSGAAESRNNALRNATGKWISFLDSDDLWVPTKLEKQIAFMHLNKFSFSFTNYIEIDENDKPIGKKVVGPNVISKHKMYNFCYIGCLTAMYDREKIGLIQINPKIKKRNDYAIWLKVVKKYNAHRLDEELAMYRRREGSISNVSIKKLLKAHYTLFRVSEGKSVLGSFFLVIRNVWFGFWKKRIYVKKYKVGD